MTANNLEQRIDQAMGNEKADLVIKNVTILNLKTGQKTIGDIAICDDKIVGVCDDYAGREQIDGTGLYATAGFIDTHLHIESSLVTPHEFERMVLPMGTTAAFPDPHEIANVIGTEAFDFFLESASTTIMDLMINLSSCVPATPIGTSGAIINAKDIAPYVTAAHTHGLAEVMNIPAVINKDPDMMAKLGLFQDGHIDGHMPGLGLDLGLDPAHGKMLNALSAAGIQTDHECSALTEAFEKQRRGINILIREGTAAKNLEALMPLITTENSFSTALCTDDFHPADIVAHGHINHLIAKAIVLYDPAMHGTDKDKHIMNVSRMPSSA